SAAGAQGCRTRWAAVVVLVSRLPFRGAGVVGLGEFGGSTPELLGSSATEERPDPANGIPGEHSKVATAPCPNDQAGACQSQRRKRESQVRWLADHHNEIAPMYTPSPLALCRLKS